MRSTRPKVMHKTINGIDLYTCMHTVANHQYDYECICIALFTNGTNHLQLLLHSLCDGYALTLIADDKVLNNVTGGVYELYAMFAALTNQFNIHDCVVFDGLLSDLIRSVDKGE